MFVGSAFVVVVVGPEPVLDGAAFVACDSVVPGDYRLDRPKNGNV